MLNVKQINMTDVEVAHLNSLMSWFDSEQAVRDWAGPGVGYPLSAECLHAQLDMSHKPALGLELDGSLISFGQFYELAGCCHLCRLVVAPRFRGHGMFTTLFEALVQKAVAQLQLPRLSLFVYKHNQQAISAYQKQGFVVSQYPLEPVQDCLYMTKQLAQ